MTLSPNASTRRRSFPGLVLSLGCFNRCAPADLLTIPSGGRYFARLDLADAYLHLEVAPWSRLPLTINFHRGLFQCYSLPIGVKTAPSVCQKCMSTILAGIPGVAAYLDDLLIVASSQDELRKQIDEVLQRIQDNGLRLWQEKCEFFLTSVKYLGFNFDDSSRHPDPKNIRAIQ
ncbi:unnamed protein product [Mesocestoides corti]|uniref:Reverse transcriptase domain-containing protein n=1 Tax=Mesocestoides corti TaxID=53468 RepID=A0A3P6I0B8_MESCO|nr:unnamed protein product [Mesocestoides corti]